MRAADRDRLRWRSPLARAGVRHRRTPPSPAPATSASRSKARPATLNAITDVAGVSVGQVTLIEDLADGHKVRTGVTAILPRGRASLDTPVFGGWFALNGNGEMTGTAWLEESGQLEGPVMLTNTHSVGVVRDAVIAERVQGRRRRRQRLLVVAAGRRRDLGRPPQRHQRLPREARARRAGAARCHAAARSPRATSAAAPA